MKKIPDNVPMSTQVKVNLVMNKVNELLEELQKYGIISIEEDNDKESIENEQRNRNNEY